MESTKILHFCDIFLEIIKIINSVFLILKFVNFEIN